MEASLITRGIGDPFLFTASVWVSLLNYSWFFLGKFQGSICLGFLCDKLCSGYLGNGFQVLMVSNRNGRDSIVDPKIL